MGVHIVFALRGELAFADSAGHFESPGLGGTHANLVARYFVFRFEDGVLGKGARFWDRTLGFGVRSALLGEVLVEKRVGEVDIFALGLLIGEPARRATECSVRDPVCRARSEGEAWWLLGGALRSMDGEGN